MGGLQGPSRAHVLWMSTVACLVSSLLSATSMAQVEVVIVPPSALAIAGATTEFILYFTNASGEDVLFQVPASLAGTLMLGEEPTPITLHLADASQAHMLTLRVQGFQKIAYRTHLPATLAGPVMLHVNGWQANTPYVMVAASRAQTTPADEMRTASAERAAQPGGDTAPHEPEATDGKNIFFENISAYKPVYFLYGAAPSDAKFQLSFKYRFLHAEGTLARQWPWLLGLHVAYTQISFWNLAAESLPFEDTNFKPELFYLWEGLALTALPRRTRFDAQLGFQHESNGRSGDDSRSLNIAYIRPRIVFDIVADYELSLAAQAWFYVGDLSDNSTIRDFSRLVELICELGHTRGLSSVLRGARQSEHWERQRPSRFHLSSQ